MGTNSDAAKAAAQRIKEKYGDDFFSKIGGKANASWDAGGRKPRGFSTMSPEQRSAAGKKGGKNSKRKSD